MKRHLVLENTINTSNDCYFYSLCLPNYPSFEKARLHISFNLKLALQTSISNLEVWLASFTSVDGFHQSLTTLLESDKKRVLSPALYSNIFTELNSIGNQAKICESFSKITITHKDSCDRTHKIIVDVPAGYPFERATVEEHELPIDQQMVFQQDKHDFTGAKTLLEINTRFKELIDKFQVFWDLLHNFDSSCWVLEPVHPRMSDRSRRIKVSNECSALLTFNPFNPQQCPTIEFRGSSDEVMKFRSVLGKNLLEDVWDQDVDTYLNVLSVLDLECLPLRTSDLSNEEGNALLQQGECGICFEDRSEGHAANERCGNDKCSSQYHAACLLKYLRTSPNHLRIKNAIMGKCPTCRETIGCSINVMSV